MPRIVLQPWHPAPGARVLVVVQVKQLLQHQPHQTPQWTRWAKSCEPQVTLAPQKHKQKRPRAQLTSSCCSEGKLKQPN